MDNSLKQKTVKDGDAKSGNYTWLWLVVVSLSIWFIISAISKPYPTVTADIDYVCRDPKVIQQWHIRAFRPKWFGLFGGPAPITYKITSPKGHQISIVDIDRRDIEIEIWVDDKDFGYRPVQLDDSINCGDDLEKCISMGFGAAMISIPSGKHVVKAQILDDKGKTFKWGNERKRRVLWKVEECLNVERVEADKAE